MNDTPFQLTPVATIFVARAGDAWTSVNGDWRGNRVYTSLDLAKSCAARDYADPLVAAGTPVDVLDWRDRDCWWELYEAGRPTGIEIDEQSIWGELGVEWVPVLETDGS